MLATTTKDMVTVGMVPFLCEWTTLWAAPHKVNMLWVEAGCVTHLAEGMEIESLGKSILPLSFRSIHPFLSSASRCFAMAFCAMLNAVRMSENEGDILSVTW